MNFFFFVKKMTENNIFKKCILRKITASIFLGMSLNMARNCFLGTLAYVLIKFFVNFSPFSQKCFSAKFLSILRVFVQYSNKLN